MITLPAAVVDLDNCISDDLWRHKFMELHLPMPNDRYAKYHEQCHFDTFLNRQAMRDLSWRYKIIIITSRPEAVRMQTEGWLRKWNIDTSLVLMRPDDNHEGSVDLKRKLLRSIPDTFQVQHAIDDRVDILDMYADEGICRVQRVFIHTTEQAHP
jgi:hypothetical protein